MEFKLFCLPQARLKFSELMAIVQNIYVHTRKTSRQSFPSISRDSIRFDSTSPDVVGFRFSRQESEVRRTNRMTD